MFRFVLSFIVFFAFNSFTNADTPTEANFLRGIDRYNGEWHIIAKGSSEPIGYFESHWKDIGNTKMTEFSFMSIGIWDETQSRSVGFCFWNEKENRAEFNEIDNGEEGCVSYAGYCLDVTATSMTWLVTGWTEKGFLRQTKMKDTFTKTGLDRTVEHLKGKKSPKVIVEWKKLNVEKSKPDYPDQPGN